MVTTVLEFRPVSSLNIEDVSTSIGTSLRQFIHKNHNEYGIRIHEELAHHNHTPHLLGSAYFLGATEEQLVELDTESCNVTSKWTDSPDVITDESFVKHLGEAKYQKAYVQYFEDSSRVMDWQHTAKHWLFSGPRPLANSLMSGLVTHPMIHLAYAVELQSKELAIEALGLAATCYDFMQQYMVGEAGPTASLEPLQVIENIRNDPRFNEAKVQTIHTMKPLFDVSEEAFLEHWRSWSPDMDQMQLAQKLAVIMLAGPKENDFALCHVLTSYHALRVILPCMEPDVRVSLVRQWWLWTIGAYVMQGRPSLSADSIHNYSTQSRDWEWVKNQALTSKWRNDHHYVKAIRAIMNAMETWGDSDDFYLKAAIRYVDKFNDWTGFGEEIPSFKRHIA